MAININTGSKIVKFQDENVQGGHYVLEQIDGVWKRIDVGSGVTINYDQKTIGFTLSQHILSDTSSNPDHTKILAEAKLEAIMKMITNNKGLFDKFYTLISFGTKFALEVYMNDFHGVAVLTDKFNIKDGCKVEYTITEVAQVLVEGQPIPPKKWKVTLVSSFIPSGAMLMTGIEEASAPNAFTPSTNLEYEIGAGEWLLRVLTIYNAGQPSQEATQMTFEITTIE